MSELTFAGKESVYAQNRPSYPREFIDFLYDEIGFNTNSIIADIGAGTGKFTRPLLERGSRVYAVEPGANMRAAAQSYLSGFSNFVAVDGTAEETTLGNGSVDFITVATAFHWFDRQRFKDECRRILTDGGKVVIVYNSRDEMSAVVKGLYEVCGKYCPAFEGFVASGTLLFPENAGKFDSFFSGGYITKIMENNLAYSEQGFIGRCLSSSYALKQGDENYDAYIRELKALFEKFSENGVLVMPNITHGYIGAV